MGEKVIAVLIVLLAGSFAVNIFFWSVPEGTADSPMLNVDMYQWGYEEFDPNTIRFAYWIMNYGGTEAKDIVVRCKLSNTEQGTVVSETTPFGNLASFSGDLGDLQVNISQNTAYSPNRAYSGYCYVESCSGDCVILHKKIPDLIESYETE